MKKYPVFMDQNNKYHLNVYATQSYLYFPCNTYKNSIHIFHMKIFHRKRSAKICIELQKNRRKKS